jgi:hypothetical protein
MIRNRAGRWSVLLGSAAICAACGVVVAADDIPWSLKESLEQPLKQRVRDLLKKQNDHGIQNVRGFYLDRFVKIDEDTYEVIFYTRTALAEELHVTRQLFTLVREGKGWSIGDEKLEKEITGYFFRSTPGDETFHAFDSFEFEKEGIRVRGGSGTLYLDHWRGKPWRMSLRANDLTYSYAPPADTPYAGLYPVFKKRYAEDVDFRPVEVSLTCGTANCEELLETSFSGLRETALGDIHPDLAKKYGEFKKDLEKSRTENPMVGFSREERPDNRWWSLQVFRDKDHRVRLGYDDLAPREVGFSVSGRGTVYRYHSEPTRRSGTRRADLERRPDQSRMDYEVVSLTGRIDLALEDASTMRADLAYKLNMLQPVDLVFFNIQQIGAFRDETKDAKDPALDIELIEDGEGQELTFVKWGATSGYIILPREVSSGEELIVHVKYTNSDAIYKLNPFYSYVSRGGWLPFVKFGDMIDEYDLTFTVPSRYSVLGVGHMASTESGARTTTARFTSDSRVQFPTVIFGKYTSDHSKIAVTKSDGSKVPVNVHVDNHSMSGAGWGIRVNALRPIADQAANALNLFQGILGVDYPHQKLDVVNAVFQNPFSGQSPASIVYLGGAVFRGTGAVANAVVDSGGMSKFMESVVAHEVGHQWWGGSVAHANWRNYWFVESLSEYMAALYLESLHGIKDAKQGWNKYLDKVESWRRNILATDILASVQDSDSMWLGESYGLARKALIYDYGPYAFHMLRMTFRDYGGGTGDEKFFGYLKRLTQELQGREIVTSDIQQIAEAAFGGVDAGGDPYKVDLSWFFDQWIRGVGIPELKLDYETRQAEDGNWIVQGAISQRILAGKNRDVLPGKTYRGLVLITVTGEKQVFNVPVALEGAEVPFGFKVPVKPARVTMNASGEILAHECK